MKINKIAVSTSDMSRSVEFYKILGLKFPDFKGDEQHIESLANEGSVPLMIDTVELMKQITGTVPTPGSHSSFAVEYDTVMEIDSAVDSLRKGGFTIEKAPWKAFWGQYYAIVADPDGHKVDLYSSEVPG